MMDIEQLAIDPVYGARMLRVAGRRNGKTEAQERLVKGLLATGVHLHSVGAGWFRCESGHCDAVPFVEGVYREPARFPFRRIWMNSRQFRYEFQYWAGGAMDGGWHTWRWVAAESFESLPASAIYELMEEMR